jgi:hypothetical protein
VFVFIVFDGVLKRASRGVVVYNCQEIIEEYVVLGFNPVVVPAF